MAAARSVAHLMAALVLSIAVLALPVAPGGAAPATFPERIDLPSAFRPEGIAIGRGTTFFVGSIPTGNLYRGDLRTGVGEVFHVAEAGSAAIGLAVDQQDRVFVAGGTTGEARVVDGRTGALLATYTLADPDDGATFVNDVVIAGGAAWFTDSFRPVLYRVPLSLGAAASVPVGGDFTFQPGAFNLNGIEATPDGSALVAVQSGTGELFAVDPASGAAQRIDLGGESVANGDGLVLAGHTLHVVQNRDNLVAVVRLSPDLTEGTLLSRVTDSTFDVPTTAARFGDRIYAVNARFSTPPTPDTEYWVTAIDRP